jgi:hypothetical protein
MVQPGIRPCSVYDFRLRVLCGALFCIRSGSKLDCTFSARLKVEDGSSQNGMTPVLPCPGSRTNAKSTASQGRTRGFVQC